MKCTVELSTVEWNQHLELMLHISWPAYSLLVSGPRSELSTELRVANALLALVGSATRAPSSG